MRIGSVRVLVVALLEMDEMAAVLTVDPFMVLTVLLVGGVMKG